MTVRTAELAMAVAMAFLSIYLMWKSAELPIGWIPDEGPGGGAFPFWLSFGMLVCCGWVLFKWVKKTSPCAISTESYFNEGGFELFLLGAGSLAVMIGLIHIVGVYGSVPLFIAFYMRTLGKHSWGLTLLIAGLLPVVTFFFFEVALTITLPKGMTEPLFYPLYDWFM